MTGFIPVRDSAGKPLSSAATRYFVSASDATALYIGDPVAINGTNTETGANYRTITKATLTTNNKWCGVVVGFEPVSPELATTAPNLENKHRPASVNAYAWVIDDPDAEFWIGEDGVTAVLTTAEVGNLGLAAAGAGGNTSYGKSSVVLASNSFVAGSSTGQVLLIGKVDAPGNDLGTGTTSTAKWRVKINPAMHQLVTPSTTV